jgi:hypothetical protein
LQHVRDNEVIGLAASRTAYNTDMGIPACFLIVHRQEYILGQDDVVPSVMTRFPKRLCESFVVFVQIFDMPNDRGLSE